jgi:hypothetical protein
MSMMLVSSTRPQWQIEESMKVVRNIGKLKRYLSDVTLLMLVVIHNPADL